MSLHQGWGEDELRVVGEETNEASVAVNAVAQDYPISSFTPINLNQVQAQYINPFDMHHYRPLDALPDKSPEPPAKKSTKRPAAKMSVGRTHSIGAVWEFQDEGDLEVQGQQDQHPPKRRKSAPAKRSKSAKAPSQPPPQMPKIDEEGPSKLQNDKKEQPNSQLTTPPDSAKRTKSKTGPQSKKSKLPPFKSLTVTKQVSKQEKQPASDPVPSPSAVKSQLGWTTTQQTVKLAKTTLDKLAAFQYKAPPQANSQDPVVATDWHTKSHSIAGIHRSDIVEDVDVSASSDYGPLPSSDGFFNAACANTGVDDVLNGEHLINVPGNNYLQTSQIPEKNSFATTELEVLQAPAPETDRGTASSYPYNNGNSSEAHIHPENPAMSSQEASCFDQPTSSEARAMGALVHGTEMNLADQQPTQGEPQHCNERPDEFSVEIVPAGQSAPSCMVSSEAGDTDLSLPEQEPEEVLQVFEPTFQTQLVQTHQPRLAKDIQVERLDDDQFDVAPKDVSRDFDLDEFDEGLDDSDLLDFASDAIVPATQFHTLSTPQQNERSSDIITSPLGPVENRDLPGILPRTVSTTKIMQANRLKGKHAVRAVEIHEPDDEDDFPMDAADEAMMVEAADEAMVVEAAEVVETFEPPDSVQRPFDDSDSVEVYDSSLQFSPPKPQQPCLSLSKAADSLCTDTISKPQSPDLEPPTTSLEEDWSFIRRAEIAANAPSESDGGYRCSVVDPTTVRLMTEFFKPHSTQQTTDSTNHILDESHEYLPLKAFVRPDFPTLTPDRSPIVGVSAARFLRVCFRIGEMIKEGGRRNALGQDAVIELFAKVVFSTREAQKQRFQFKDIFTDKPPIADGVLMNYKSTGLAESESKVFIGKHQGKLARCLGKLKRDKKTASGWMLHILTIRETDWEEIRWTKRIVSAGLVKSEPPKV